jgi:SAM-dependent methyltransferase
MKLYRHHLFPAAYDLLMGMARMEDRRRPALVAVRGEVLEIGIGTGLNLDHYPPEVRRITGLDPNPGMLRQLESRRRKSQVDVTAHCAGAERMPFADRSFDTVVSTHTLCSLPDRAAALAEVRRVLRPGGRFVFLEHGLSPDPRVARWQRRLNGIQRRFAAGCLLDVPVKDEITAAGLRITRLDEGYHRPDARTHSYLYEGFAERDPDLRGAVLEI